jgi:hypothetical protein
MRLANGGLLSWIINVKKTYQFKLSVEDNKYDTSSTVNIKISGREALQLGFNVLQQLYSWAFVKLVKSSVHVSVLSDCVCVASSLTVPIF